MSVEISNESGRQVDETRIVACSRHVMAALGIPAGAELSVLVVDLETMAQLHERWMDLPGPTDVMAFPQDDAIPGHPGEEDIPPALLGDVVLCPEFAQGNAREAGHELEDELDLLTVHGILHLVGHDHHEEEEAREMFARQRQLLTSWAAVRTAASS
jgi:probable rRNA maturation factor